MVTTVMTTRLAEYQPVVRGLGGKTVYRVAADFDLCPQERGSDGSDPFTAALREVDAVVTQTDTQACWALELLGRESVGISPSVRIPEKREPAEKDTILWVGQCYALKRPWAFLELARAFPDERFVMIAPDVGAPYFFDAIADSAKSLANLELIESVPYSEIQHHFDQAKVFVNTSLVEGFPNTFHQAAIARTPVLSLSWNTGDYLTATGIGQCAHGDMNVLIEQLRGLLEDSTLRTTMGETARCRVEQYNDVRIVVEDWKRLFRSLVGDDTA